MFLRKLGGKVSLDEKVINIQRWIARILISILIFLILFNAFGNLENAQILNNSYLPIISGWIGIILGFYFSREIADIINKKLKETQKDRKRDAEQVAQEYEKFREETDDMIIDIIRSKENERKRHKR